MKDITKVIKYKESLPRRLHSNREIHMLKLLYVTNNTDIKRTENATIFAGMDRKITR